MRDAANTICSGLSLAGRALYALLSEGWTVLCFWPAVVFGLWDIARAMLVLTAGLAGGEESHLLGVYLKVLMCTVMLRLLVKVWLWGAR
jgi:hypothetical protein